MNINTRLLLTLTTLFTITAGASACGTTKVRADTTAPAYAAEAFIKLSENKTGNGELTIVIDYLAPPQRIDKKMAGYVAWAHVEGQQPIKLGVLEYSERKRHGELHAATPQKEFRVTVTLEPKLDGPAPTGAVILDKHVVAKF